MAGEPAAGSGEPAGARKSNRTSSLERTPKARSLFGEKTIKNNKKNNKKPLKNNMIPARGPQTVVGLEYIISN